MLRVISIVAGLCLMSVSTAWAGGSEWLLSVSKSSIAIGSVTNGGTATTDHLSLLSGNVADDGTVIVEVDGQSAQSLIDVGNPDLVRYAFEFARPTAVLRTRIDRAKVEGLQPDEVISMPVSGVVILSGMPKAVNTRLRIKKQTADRVQVTSNDRATVDLDELGKTTGLGGMVEMLGLSGVKRTTTIAMNLVFERADGE